MLPVCTGISGFLEGRAKLPGIENGPRLGNPTLLLRLENEHLLLERHDESVEMSLAVRGLRSGERE